jgi:hypothetical protein
MKHKHYGCIVAWAEGKQIQYYDNVYGKGRWTDISEPIWSENTQYRVKHKHQDIIDAEKEGKQIQFYSQAVGEWVDIRVGYGFNNNLRYRIRPKIRVEFESDKEVQNSINDLIDCFDFEKVKKVMDFLEWEWCGCCNGIPEIYDLRKRARQLLNYVYLEVKDRAVKNPDQEVRYFTATGGFWVDGTKYPDDSKVYLRLTFQLADWDNFL